MAEEAYSSGAVRYRDEDELRRAVFAIVLELVPGDKAAAVPEARLVDDLGYHSLALLEMAFAIEDEFDMPPIDEPTARRIVRVVDVLDHVVSEYRSSSRLG
jgi:acyl carrier protein